MVGTTATDVAPTMGVKIFSAGVAACLADVITFPLDTAKVRLQVKAEEDGEAPQDAGVTSAMFVPLAPGFGVTTLSRLDGAGCRSNIQRGVDPGLGALEWETGTFSLSNFKFTRPEDEDLMLLSPDPSKATMCWLFQKLGCVSLS